MSHLFCVVVRHVAIAEVHNSYLQPITAEKQKAVCLKITVSKSFNATLTCKSENSASFIPSLCPEGQI